MLHFAKSVDEKVMILEFGGVVATGIIVDKFTLKFLILIVQS